VLSPPQVKDASGYEPGQQLNLEDMFKAGDFVDVAGTTIGKGFQGEWPPCRPSCVIY
jgi:ribosomal protein L3